MKRKGRARRNLILELASPHLEGVIVDVGCDHGHIARALGAIGVERRSNRLPRRGDISLVVCDGLTAFRRVDLAIVTGMGPHTILRILAEGPRPSVAVVHSPDRTESLRRGLKAQGWRIDAEGLAPENERFAEVIRVVPGEEPSEGLDLAFGPGLANDPLVEAHVANVRAHWQRLVEQAPAGSVGHRRAEEWLAFLEAYPSSRAARS